MIPLYDSGIRLVSFLQSFGWLDLPMRFFSFVGTQDFFIFVLPVVYWCIDATVGIRIGFILLLSNALNEIAKLVFHWPRPYWVSAQVKALSAEASFGAPSGHAQIAAGVWGTLAGAVRRPWAWMLGVMIIFLVGISRIYLAVHFPQDVLIGWFLGGITLWAFNAMWDSTAAWLKRVGFLQQVLVGAGVTLVMILIDGVLSHALRGYVMPTDWLTNAARAGQPYPDPLSMEGVLTSSGALLGLAIGLAWIQRRGGYRPSGPVWKRIVCLGVGLLGLLVLYLGLSCIIPSSTSVLGSAFRLLRYALIGVWVSAGAPFTFRALRLQ